MRVIAGSARGCALKAPAGMSTRPTTDRVKESMFAVIQFEVQGQNVLDLFAGSGALGIEALSRGAAHAVFVDKNEKSVALIKENLKKTKLTDKALILKQDYLQALKGSSQKFGLVFLDPPYALGLYESALAAIMEYGLLEEGGLIVMEYDPSYEIKIPEGYAKDKEKKYGSTMLAFLKKA